MLLAVDIGNTNVKLGAFQGPDLLATWRIATDPRRTPDEYAALVVALLAMRGIAPTQVERVALCSVVPPLTAVFREVARDVFGTSPLVVGENLETGLRVLYEPPADVGADRLVASAAAYRRLGGPVIVVEFGTATVFDAVSAAGEYLGGAIHPGLQLAAEALFTGTSQLRRIELRRPAAAIGRTTIGAIQSGVVLGHVGMVEGMIARFRREMGEGAPAVATGGLARLIAAETAVFASVDEDLILHGLRLLSGTG
ncbi:MAG: type III pantothenate kinase [Armatimonadota bacterium]|nr:type III pantothenate kinase [Armatimonadota bacterium]